MENKPKIMIGHMSKEDQKKHLTEHIKKKKFQVNVEIMGKKKFAYCDNLSELDDFIRKTNAKILKVIELKKC